MAKDANFDLALRNRWLGEFQFVSVFPRIDVHVYWP
jgi:hypothetical protein